MHRRQKGRFARKTSGKRPGLRANALFPAEQRACGPPRMITLRDNTQAETQRSIDGAHNDPHHSRQRRCSCCRSHAFCLGGASLHFLQLRSAGCEHPRLRGKALRQAARLHGRQEAARHQEAHCRERAQGQEGQHRQDCRARPRDGARQHGCHE